MKSNIIILWMLFFISCSKPEARRPINPKASTTVSNLVKENKIINELENKKIEQLIVRDSINLYKASTKGFWYTYIKKTVKNTQNPQKGDVVIFSYDIRNLQGNTLYTKEELGIKKYTVDKEDFISGLQDGIKLMKKGEIITFVVPSYRAFGVTGDGNKKGINQSIISTITLIDIKKNENN